MKKTIIRSAIFLLLLIVTVLLFLWIVSPQSTPDFKDAENSIAIIEDIELNGVNQRVVIRGRDKSNPLLLHLHGGPGSPDLALWQHAGLDIEDIFTVCYWDQRGAGASYHDDIDPGSMTIEQLAHDGVVLAELLTKRFGKEKIFLQGHSFGTVIASFMASRSPELFQAYIGIGQVANKQLSEQRSFDFALDACLDADNTADADRLKAIGRPPYANEQLTLQAVGIQRPIMRKYENPNAGEGITIWDIYKIFSLYKGYSIADKLNALKGDAFSMNTLWPKIRDLNMNYKFPNWKVPFYIIQGKYDQHTVTSVAKEYYDYVIAPKKKYFEFEHSAHDPHLDEQDRYRAVLKEIIADSVDSSL